MQFNFPLADCHNISSKRDGKCNNVTQQALVKWFTRCILHCRCYNTTRTSLKMSKVSLDHHHVLRRKAVYIAID